jgi:hypothetical protein
MAATYHNPVRGMTKGTRQGLYVCSVLLAILLGLTVFRDVSPGTPLARVLDFVLGLCFAIAVTFVVGGIFEIDGKIKDFSLKAGGGAAILFATMFWLQPISSAQPAPRWKKVVVLPADETLSFIIGQVDSERRQGDTAYKFDYGGQEDMIRRLRPLPPSAGSVTYNGNSWPEIFDRIDDDASCLNITVDETSSVISLKLSDKMTRTADQTVGDGRTVTQVLCTP